MTGTAPGRNGDFGGAGAASPIGLPCGHDEAALRAAAAGLAAAQEDADGARAAVARLETAEWAGPAADAFRGSAAGISAQVAAIAAGLAGLSLLVASVQAEGALCPGLPALSGMAAPPRGLLADGPLGPVAPLASPAPALRLEVPTGPAFLRGGSGEACR